MSKLPEYKSAGQDESAQEEPKKVQKVISWIKARIPKLSNETKWKLTKGTAKAIFLLAIGGIFGVGLLTVKNWASNLNNKDRNGLEELADTYRVANKVDGGGKALTNAIKDRLDWRCEPTQDKTDAVCVITVKKQEEVK